MHKGEGCARGMKEDAGYHARCSMDSSRSSDDIDSKYSDMALIHRGRCAWCPTAAAAAACKDNTKGCFPQRAERSRW
jgi:hypothetical protein